MTAPSTRASADRSRTDAEAPAGINPWHALWAMLVGFFMILVDSTIVAVVNPELTTALQADIPMVIWVTSAYLLAYAVPLLFAGRLGDQYGPKRLYLIGLAVFTAASLWCGLSGTIEMLIAARVVQGLGAALLTPQTLTMITRIFPAERRGVAMSLWGATAGVATLVGPLAGGVLVDALSWEWIFFINVPIGVIGLLLGARLIPALPTHRHQFDVLGVLLSGVGMFLIVFGLQEGQQHEWAPWIWGVIVTGIGVMALFVVWQSVNRNEPLVPLRIFADRDFSVSTIGVAVIGFAVTAMILLVMFYAQWVCGFSPTRAALLMAPMALVSGLLAPAVGVLVDRAHPTPVIGFGFAALAAGMTWMAMNMTAATPIWRLVLGFVVMGVGMAFIWSPLAATATRKLDPQLAGAGSGVYNATRQVGSVLGSAGIAAYMSARISAELPGSVDPVALADGAAALPEWLREPFAAAMGQSMLLPAFVCLFGVAAALCLAGVLASVNQSAAKPREPVPAEDVYEASTEIIPIVGRDDLDPDDQGGSAYLADYAGGDRAGGEYGGDRYGVDDYGVDDYAVDDYGDGDYGERDYQGDPRFADGYYSADDFASDDFTPDRFTPDGPVPDEFAPDGFSDAGRPAFLFANPVGHEGLSLQQSDGEELFGGDLDDDWIEDDDEYVEFTVARDAHAQSAHRSGDVDEHQPHDDEYHPHDDEYQQPYFDRRGGGYPDDPGYEPFDVADDDYLDAAPRDDGFPADDADTEPLAVRVPRPLTPPDTRRHVSVADWQALVVDRPPLDPEERQAAQSIGHAHNGFHVPNGEKLQPTPPPRRDPERTAQYYADAFRQLSENIDSLSDSFADSLGTSWDAFSKPTTQGSSRHRLPDDDQLLDDKFPEDQFPELPSDGEQLPGATDVAEPPPAQHRRPRHYRDDPDDTPSYGRHSRP